MNSNEEKEMDDRASDMEVICGESRKIKVNGVIYTITPCPMSQLPILQKKFLKFSQVKEDEVLDETYLKLMAEIIQMGIAKHHTMSVKEIMDAFPMESFPVIMEIMLGLNNFLSQMRMVVSQVTSLKTPNPILQGKPVKKS